MFRGIICILYTTYFVLFFFNMIQHGKSLYIEPDCLSSGIPFDLKS